MDIETAVEGWIVGMLLQDFMCPCQQRHDVLIVSNTIQFMTVGLLSQATMIRHPILTEHRNQEDLHLRPIRQM